MSLLYKNQIIINESLSIRIPTLRDILLKSGEDKYISDVISICSNPRDYILPLHNMGLKYTKMAEYDLFNLLFPIYQSKVLDEKEDFIFTTDITRLQRVEDEITHDFAWVNEKGEKVIDSYTHSMIDNKLRELVGIEKKIGKAGNSIQYEREIKKKIKELKKQSKSQSSFIEKEIIMAVNDCGFKYNYDTVMDLTLYQFNQSVKQILHSKELDYIKTSAYVGMFDIKKLSKEEISLIPFKD